MQQKKITDKQRIFIALFYPQRGNILQFFMSRGRAE